MRLVAGDIGGTHTRLAIVEGGELSALRTLQSQRYAGLEDALEVFLAEVGVEAGSIDAAAFGIAGPVTGELVQVTNLPWTVDAGVLARTLKTDAIRLLNDLEAAAFGLDRLGPEDTHTLQGGAREAQGPVVLIGAGTGLGKAVRVPRGATEPLVLRSEGGHASFAPASPEDDALLSWLRQRKAHVSVEDVVSGPGLAALFAFLRARSKPDPSSGPPLDAAGVTLAAQAGDPTAALALERFARLYGAEAGNLALNVLPRGGLYVTGGVAPRLRGVMGERFDALFLEGMRAKGRMATLLGTVHVELVVQPLLPLLGAASAAGRLARP